MQLWLLRVQYWFNVATDRIGYKNVLIGFFLITGFSISAAQSSTPLMSHTLHIAMVLPRPLNATEHVMQENLKKRGLKLNYTVFLYQPDRESTARLNAQIRACKPDLIYTWGASATLAVAGPFDANDTTDYIRDIPLIFNAVIDPVRSRIVANLKQHGRNITGIINTAPLLTQVNIIQTYYPFKHVGHIYNPLSVDSLNTQSALEKFSAKHAFQYTALALPLVKGKPNIKTIPHLIAQLKQVNVDLLYLDTDPLISIQNRQVITEAALKAKIATFSTLEEPIRMSKALFGLYTANTASGRMAGFKIAQHLARKKPISAIPIEALHDFTLLINIPIAQALRNYPPLSLLEIAEVISA